MQHEDPQFEVPSIEQLTAEQGRTEPEAAEQEPTSAVSAVLARHHDALIARKDVTMLGEGLDVAGRPAIVIGVKTTAGLRGLPKDLDGVPVVTQITGEITAQGKP